MNILIIEDDIILASQIARTFYRRVMTHRVDIVTCTREFDIYKSSLRIYDIILVDLILSPIPTNVVAGYDIIKEIREQGAHASIIVISGIDDVSVLQKAFSLGAIDYLIKPFRLAELEVRVEHWFARFYIDAINTYTHTNIGDLRYDTRRNEFYKGEKKVPLSRTSKYLLSLFLREPGSPLSHEFIRERVWGDIDTSRERNIRVAILRLRKSLEPFSLHRCIGTIPGEGYIFDTETLF